MTLLRDGDDAWLPPEDVDGADAHASVRAAEWVALGGFDTAGAALSRA